MAFRHVNLTLVHIAQHLLGAFGPNLIISGMPEKPDADDSISSKSQAHMRFQVPL
jgi:hypothetical protein